MPKDAGTSREALSKAKQQGWDRFVLHRASANRDAARRKTLAAGDAIMRAIKDSRLTFVVQPIVDGVTGETKLYECLLRMLDENGDLFLAALFTPVVEQLGLIRRQNKYTLELAFLEMEAVKRVNLAVNISGASATGSTTPDHLLSLVQMHSSVADWLTFEITEPVAMMDYEEPASFANKRPELGCRIALTDFGGQLCLLPAFKKPSRGHREIRWPVRKGPARKLGKPAGRANLIGPGGGLRRQDRRRMRGSRGRGASYTLPRRQAYAGLPLRRPHLGTALERAQPAHGPHGLKYF